MINQKSRKVNNKKRKLTRHSTRKYKKQRGGRWPFSSKAPKLPVASSSVASKAPAVATQKLTKTESQIKRYKKKHGFDTRSLSAGDQIAIRRKIGRGDLEGAQTFELAIHSKKKGKKFLTALKTDQSTARTQYIKEQQPIIAAEKAKLAAEQAAKVQAKLAAEQAAKVQAKSATIYNRERQTVIHKQARRNKPRPAKRRKGGMG